MNLTIEYINKNDLKPYENNAKIHTDEQVEQIKKSIEQFGFNDPIAVWKNNEVIEGHGRLLAAMQINSVDSIPVIRLDELTDQQRKAYALVHNKLTMNTGFDLELLQQELMQINSIEMSDFGFRTIDQMAEDLTDFFQEEEKEIFDDDDTDEEEPMFQFIIKTTDENKELLINFLEQERIIYE